MKKINYLIKLVWQEHRKLLRVSSILIPILVFLPYLQIYLSKLIAEVVGQRYPVRAFFLIGVFVWLIRLSLTTVKEFGLSFMKRDSNCLVHTLLKQVDKKTMIIDI